MNGVATFSNLSVSRAGSGLIMMASATGLAGASSNPFDAVTGAATNLTLSSGGGQTGAPSAALSQPVVVLLADAAGNPIVDAIVTFTPAAGNGTVAPVNATTSATGLASTIWTLGAPTGPQTLQATAGVLTIPVTATATAPTNHLVVTGQPSASQVAGVSLTPAGPPAITVEARDPSNFLIANFTGAVTLSIGTNPGGATLGGSVTANAVGGVATFSCG